MDFSSALSPQITRALSNTFIYSLWQGLLLAAAAGLIIMLTQKSVSRRRYNLLIASLTLFSAGVVVTFIYQLQQPVAETPASLAIQQSLPQVQADAVRSGPSVTPVADNISFIDYINTHAGTIVLIWFLIVCARGLQLLTGLHGLYRLRHQAVSPVSRDWEEKLQQLSVKMGIQQMVTMAESGLAKVPMVIGHLKPIILIPAGLITSMPPAEIEAVLIHELAHIRRRDYLVNLLQHLVEIIFFFNPAVLWVSSLIKAERENCCDDITLTQTNSKAAYIRALISCQEYQLRTPRLAMALGKRKNLLGRVSRMVSSSNHSLSILEKSLLTICLITAGIALAAFSDKDKKQDMHHQPEQTRESIQPLQAQHNAFVCEPDTLNPGKWRIYKTEEVGNGTSLAMDNTQGDVKSTTYIFKKDGVLYQCNFEEGKMSSLYVNGKMIAPGNWSDYKPKVDKLISAHDREGKKSFTEITDRTETSITVDDSQQNGLNSLKKGAADLESEQLALADANRQLKEKLMEEKGVYYKDNAQLYNKTVTEYKAADEYKAASAADRLDVKVDLHFDKSNVQLYQPKNEYKGAADLSYPKAGGAVIKTGVQEYKPHDNRNWVTTDVLIAAMVKEGLAARPQDIKSFLISNEQMILNGKTMSAEIRQRMIDQYVKPGATQTWSIFYNFNTSTIKKAARTVNNDD